MKRGSLVIVDFRSVNPNAGVRPALVVQNDRDNGRMRNTIVVQVTANIQRVSERTQLLIDANHSDWQRSGLHRASVINCSNIYTVDQRDIAKQIGSLSEETMQAVGTCLRAAIEV